MEVWVEMCHRGFQTRTLLKAKITHFDILFKSLFHDPDTFRFAYKSFGLTSFNIFFRKKILGTTHVLHLSPTFTLF